MRFPLQIIFIVLFINKLYNQEKTYSLKSIVFYNVENLFDITNDTLIYDDAHTPEGRYNWTKKRYDLKISRLAEVLLKVVYKTTQNTPDVIGVAEVENINVVRDLITHPLLLRHNYNIIHNDSPDKRGIDVALLYKEGSFIPNAIQSRRLILYNDEGFRSYTRDQLVVTGYLEDAPFCFIVNHWPSRRGGASKSNSLRVAAARLQKEIIDSVRHMNPTIKIVSMGDYNDNPIDDSLKKVLKTKGNKTILEENDLYNPMEYAYKKGLGSLAYRDEWSLFDQFFFTANLIKDTRNSYTFWKAGIYNASFLRTSFGRYKGYPWRTYAGGAYTKGYSDHFPVYLYLIKELN